MSLKASYTSSSGRWEHRHHHCGGVVGVCCWGEGNGSTVEHFLLFNCERLMQGVSSVFNLIT